MKTEDILAAVDEQIAKWQRVRELLTDPAATAEYVPAKRRGRPKGSVNKPTAKAPKRKRVMSAEGKARIAAAQKAGWAAQKKSVKSPGKKTAPKKAAKKTAAAE